MWNCYQSLSYKSFGDTKDNVALALEWLLQLSQLVLKLML